MVYFFGFLLKGPSSPAWVRQRNLSTDLQNQTFKSVSEQRKRTAKHHSKINSAKGRTHTVGTHVTASHQMSKFPTSHLLRHCARTPIQTAHSLHSHCAAMIKLANPFLAMHGIVLQWQQSCVDFRDGLSAQSINPHPRRARVTSTRRNDFLQVQSKSRVCFHCWTSLSGLRQWQVHLGQLPQRPLLSGVQTKFKSRTSAIVWLVCGGGRLRNSEFRPDKNCPKSVRSVCGWVQTVNPFIHPNQNSSVASKSSNFRFLDVDKTILFHCHSFLYENWFSAQKLSTCCHQANHCCTQDFRPEARTPSVPRWGDSTNRLGRTTKQTLHICTIPMKRRILTILVV